MKPLLICDCDEVLMTFAGPFAEHLDEMHGLELKLERGTGKLELKLETGKGNGKGELENWKTRLELENGHTKSLNWNWSWKTEKRSYGNWKLEFGKLEVWKRKRSSEIPELKLELVEARDQEVWSEGLLARTG